MIRTLPLLVVLAVAAGCGLNRQTGLTGCETLPALGEPAGGGTGLPPPPIEPSLRGGLDRRNWPAITVVVPAGQVEHAPDYSRILRIEAPEPAFPVARTVLLSSWGRDVPVAMASYASAAVLLMWWPIDMALVRPPLVRQRGPDHAFARSGPEPPGLWSWVAVGDD